MNAIHMIKSLPLSALALFAVISASSNAAAGCCVAYEEYYEDQKHAETQQHFTTKLKETETNIVEALRLATGQLSGNLKEQTAAESNMKTLQDNRQVQQNVQNVRVRAIQQATSGASTCNVVTGAVGGQGLDAEITRYREELIQAQVDFDAGERGAAQKGAKQAIEKRLDTHCESFGTQGDVDSGACAVAVGALGNKDLNANSLIGKTTLSADDLKAAELFLATALTPRPLGALPRDAAKTDNGRKLVADRQASIARASVSTTIGTDLAALHKPFSTSVVTGGGGSGGSGQGTLKEWAEGTAEQTLGYSKVNGSYFPDGVSKAAWLELRAKSWFMNPNWALKVDSQPVDQTAKDLAMISAFQTYQNWESFRMLEQMNLSLATILSILEDRNREKL